MYCTCSAVLKRCCFSLLKYRQMTSSQRYCDHLLLSERRTSRKSWLLLKLRKLIYVIGTCDVTFWCLFLLKMSLVAVWVCEHYELWKLYFIPDCQTGWIKVCEYVKEARFRRESCGRTWLNILRMGGEDTVKLMLTY